MPTQPVISVSNIRLSSHRSRPNRAAAWCDLTITGRTGVVREWKGARLVFDGFWPISFPVGSYTLLVDGQYSPRTYRRGTQLIPPCWRRAARWAVYDACCTAEDAQKKREAEEIAAGTRWAPLPAEALRTAARRQCQGREGRV